MKFSFGNVISAAAKAADRAAKAASREQDKQRKQAEKLRIKLENEQRKIYAKQAELRQIVDYESRGYVFVTVKSLEKYIHGAIISESLFDDMQNATMRGASKIPVNQPLSTSRLKQPTKMSKSTQTLTVNRLGKEYSRSSTKQE